jgi:hypothetical protein
MVTIKAIRTIIRQALRDELKEGTDAEFADDELDLHMKDCLVEISQRRPYEVKETVESDGTKEVDISEIENLLEVEKAEYPTGSDPPDYRDVSVFGDTLTIDIETAPTSGDDVYLYCHKVHQLTESSSTLKPDLESVLIQGTVAKAAMAWLNKMREQIVPTSIRLYQSWATTHLMLYQNGLNSITRPRVWEFYPRG